MSQSFVSDWTPPDWLIPWLSRTHVVLYKLTTGKIGSHVDGMPCILLRTIGRRSGKPHTVCLSYLPDGDSMVVVGSFGGGEFNPAWYHNLQANPEVIVRDRERVFWATAETLTGEGININVTLIFSLQQYEDSAMAYIRGLEKLAAANVDFSRIASVASFFVSRVDGKIDPKLAEIGNNSLQGKIAIANAKMAYHRFGELFSGPRWDKLAAQGARVQRPLWGSTSTKNPDYPDTLYVDELIGPHTVNTLPPETLEAFLDHGNAARTVDADVEQARQHLAQLAGLGIDLGEVTTQLMGEGVDAFADSFDELMSGIAEKAAAIAGGDDNQTRARADFFTVPSGAR